MLKPLFKKQKENFIVDNYTTLKIDMVTAIIICDKCGKSKSSDETDYDAEFYGLGWKDYIEGNKKIHLCPECTPHHKIIKVKNKKQSIK